MDHFNINQLVDKTEREGRRISQTISISHTIGLKKKEMLEQSHVSTSGFKDSTTRSSSLAKYITPIEFDVINDSDDLLWRLEKENRLVKALKESKKNREERIRRLNIAWARRKLARHKIKPLLQPRFDSRAIKYLPDNLVNIAKYLATITGLDPLGICLAILGSVSIATWGRVSITLTPEWSEPAIDMLLQVSGSGTRKSSLASHLRMPFDQYCAQVNGGAEIRMRQKKREMTLLKKAAEKRAHQKIVTVLNDEKE
ncbi:MAG: hypothetical protein BCS36_12060 [Desulfovibrio sp. MES5]|uniref:DUF3987 domain-containing protein n=1 Tax=Desulfovibrio sp. MES5 TaxID=1899016 RepID=UPI000B9D46E7|nr:DUF3987 domain-containing protein [Desulfovibrio sp. MES5]OXS30317.1 MAG: hypothetical protein BCS36_12060 [Desulfovibrio sp. MES5]